MRRRRSRAVLSAWLAAAAVCGFPEISEGFELGVLAPVGPKVQAAAPGAGVVIAASTPEGAEAQSAAVSFAGSSGAEQERLADWSRLRFLAARAVARRRTGMFFILPKSQDGREVCEYPEEWQALVRVSREIAAARPFVESGAEAAVPFAAPLGVASRAWRRRGRLYVLLVNDSGLPAALAEEDLRPWRALFEVRADARELLVPCGAKRCLPAGGVVWLEGRLF